LDLNTICFGPICLINSIISKWRVNKKLYILALCSLFIYALLNIAESSDLITKYLRDIPLEPTINRIYWPLLVWAVLALVYFIIDHNIIIRLIKTLFYTTLDKYSLSLILAVIIYFFSSDLRISQGLFLNKDYTPYWFYIYYGFLFFTMIYIFLGLVRLAQLFLADHIYDQGLFGEIARLTPSLHSYFEELHTQGHFYILSDEPNQQDALDRNNLAEDLADILSGIKHKKAFVVGISAEWGHGKTTLIEFIKEKLDKKSNNISYIFDPWYFNNQESLILHFFKSIFESINNLYFAPSLTYTFSKYANALAKTAKESKGYGGILGTLLTTSDQIPVLKKELQEQLTALNKSIVIFVDNLDRLEKDDLLLMLKLVHLCSDFSNIVFVLLYDKKRIESLLITQHQIDPVYLEKIIQVEIQLPIASEKAIEALWLDEFNAAIVNNSPVGLGLDLLSSEDQDRLNSAIDQLKPLITNLRTAKRHINRLLFKLPLVKYQRLNIVDLIIIESIGLFYPDQYQILSINGDHFAFYSSIYPTIPTLHPNEYRRKLYDDFFNQIEDHDKRERLKVLLCLVFKSIENYYLERDPWGGSHQTTLASYRRKGIDDEELWRCYFSVSITPDLQLTIDLEQFVDGINSGSLSNKNIDSFIKDKTILGQIDSIITRLLSSYEDIKWPNVSLLIKGLYENVSLMNTYQRANILIIITNYLIKADDNGYRDAVIDLASNCSQLEIPTSIIKSHLENTNLSSARLIALQDAEKFLKDRLNELVKNKINIFKSNQINHALVAINMYLDEKTKKQFVSQVIEDDLVSLSTLVNYFAGGENNVYIADLLKFIEEADLVKHLRNYYRQNLPKNIFLDYLFKKYIS